MSQSEGSDFAVRFVYGCTNPLCDERMRGTTSERGLWCSICMEYLTLIALAPGVTEADVLDDEKQARLSLWQATRDEHPDLAEPK
jgi:hypothetical protein